MNGKDAITGLNEKITSDIETLMKKAPLRTVGAQYSHEVPYDPFSKENASEHLQVGETDLEINGVPIPAAVAEELRQLGIPLSWYNQGELMDAVLAYLVDAHVIDDHDGVSFRDKLRYDHMEKAHDEAVQQEENVSKICLFMRRLRFRRFWPEVSKSAVDSSSQVSSFLPTIPLPPPLPFPLVERQTEYLAVD